MQNTRIYTPDSEHIQEARYDQSSRKLTVTFHKGGTYIYDGVPLSIWHGLVNAKSAGAFFHENIRQLYNSHKER